MGVLGRVAIDTSKLDEDGSWGNAHTMLGFDIDSRNFSPGYRKNRSLGAASHSESYITGTDQEPSK